MPRSPGRTGGSEVTEWPRSVTTTRSPIGALRTHLRIFRCSSRMPIRFMHSTCAIPLVQSSHRCPRLSLVSSEGVRHPTAGYSGCKRAYSRQTNAADLLGTPAARGATAEGVVCHCVESGLGNAGCREGDVWKREHRWRRPRGTQYWWQQIPARRPDSTTRTDSGSRDSWGLMQNTTRSMQRAYRRSNMAGGRECRWK